MIMKKSGKPVGTEIQSEEAIKEFFKEYPKPVYYDLFEDKLEPSLEELEELIKGNPDKGIGALFLCGEMTSHGVMSTRTVLGNGSVIGNCLLKACESHSAFETLIRDVVKALDLRNEIKNNPFNEN